ncbi:MAG: electron transport complex subunit E [SAR324 cluster bacterium]|nr:electron transport complex subunit E [SAR324 cluster bacterium]
MAKKANPIGYEFNKGVWGENPVLAALLGLCPVLAVTNTAENGLAMGLATSFVLISSSFMVSILRKVIPKQVRIAGYIVIIATFVTMADRFLAAYFFEISKSLGPYIPLIVVNCLILGRQEAFASKNSIFRSLVDAIGMAVGFTWVLVILGGIREIFGSGSLFNIALFGDWFEPWMVMILPPGAFFTLGLMIAAYKLTNMKGA